MTVIGQKLLDFSLAYEFHLPLRRCLNSSSPALHIPIILFLCYDFREACPTFLCSAYSFWVPAADDALDSGDSVSDNFFCSVISASFTTISISSIHVMPFV
ncbi:hypothetical protein KSP40_PGU018705 [Platanthera guangdongensis]|uniref:Uncharacterized protein n=1 Tax=Platanthera guangdongensis TaxID=2320717 RepID=A0ABR2LK31_9ASPA